MTILLVLSAVIVVCVIGVRANDVGRQLGLMDHPDPHGGRKRHARVTPLVGGVAILPPVLVALVWTAWARATHGVSDWSDLAWIGLCVAVQAALGLVDDRHQLRPTYRLLVSMTAFVATVGLATSLQVEVLRFSGMLPPIYWNSLAPAFTVLCLVGLLNAVNMADGKNGLVIGLSLIWTLCLLFHASPSLTPLLLTLMAALGVALLFNWHGRFFLGDAGSYGLAALIGLLTIDVYANGDGTLKAGHIAIWFAVPTADCLRLMVRRVRAGRSPFSGDREHLHHHLMRLFGWPRGLFVYWLMVGLPSLVALALPDFGVPILLAQIALYAATVAYAQRHPAMHAA